MTQQTTSIFQFFLRTLCFSVCILATSCHYFQDPVFCISLHKLELPENYAPETLLIHPVNDIQGKSQGTVSQFPIVDSSAFGEVQLVKGPNDKWGLRLTMDKRGTNLWRQATVEHNGKQAAILLDGFFVASMPIPVNDNSGIIMIPPIWSEKEARQIAQHVKSNYKIINNK